MPTTQQFRLIHVAARQAGLDDGLYRLVLRNVGGVKSSKELTQAGFEDVMAVFEDSGFREIGKPPTYWRDKVSIRGVFCGERMARKITELAAEQGYALAGLCRRFSNDRVEGVDKLKPRQAWKLIEMLKAVVDRNQQAASESRISEGDGPRSPAMATMGPRMPSESSSPFEALLAKEGAICQSNSQ